MSKLPLKKYLQSLTKEQLVEVILEAYSNSKAIQEYFDFYLQPNEAACRFTYKFGDMDEPFYNGATNNFKRVLDYMNKYNLLSDFKLRCINCVKYASPCGYGFADDIADLFINYYG